MATKPANNAFRVLQLTDPHIFANRDEALREAVSWQTLSRTIRHYQSGDWRAERAEAYGIEQAGHRADPGRQEIGRGGR